MINPMETETKVGNDMITTIFPINTSEDKSQEMVEFFPIEKFTVTEVKSKMIVTKVVDPEWVLATHVVTIRKREIEDVKTEELNEDRIDIPLENEGNETLLFKREIIKPEQQPPVQVHIQNITEVREKYSLSLSGKKTEV